METKNSGERGKGGWANSVATNQLLGASSGLIRPFQRAFVWQASKTLTERVTNARVQPCLVPKITNSLPTHLASLLTNSHTHRFRVAPFIGTIRANFHHRLNMRIINIDKFSAFEELYNKYEKDRTVDGLKNLICFFTANDRPGTAQSWCPHCVLAKPFIERMYEKFRGSENTALVYIKVGQYPEWKDPNNPYRLHPFKITCVPTLISLSNGLRLNGSECADEAKLDHLFANST